MLSNGHPRKLRHFHRSPGNWLTWKWLMWFQRWLTNGGGFNYFLNFHSIYIGKISWLPYICSNYWQMLLSIVESICESYGEKLGGDIWQDPVKVTRCGSFKYRVVVVLLQVIQLVYICFRQCNRGWFARKPRPASEYPVKYVANTNSFMGLKSLKEVNLTSYSSIPRWAAGAAIRKDHVLLHMSLTKSLVYEK